jgi:pyrrolidone-carboxylate peptidase
LAGQQRESYVPDSPLLKNALTEQHLMAGLKGGRRDITPYRIRMNNDRHHLKRAGDRRSMSQEQIGQACWYPQRQMYT